MTTNVKIVKSAKVTQDENLFKLSPEASCVPLDDLSSISFVTDAAPGMLEIVKAESVSACVNLLKEKLQDYNIWLLSSNAAWQPNSAIVKHLKLWRALKKNGIDVPERAVSELSVETEDGIKFFGCTKLDESELGIGLKVLAVERMSFLILLPEQLSVNLSDYVEKEWPTAREYDFAFWTAVISKICFNNGIFLRIFGAFDDRETGVSAVMPRKIFDSNFQ